MRKIRIYNLIIFAVGLSLLSLGIQLVIKANFGVSVATSPPYILSLYFKDITFGQWNYIVHGIVLLILVVVVRRLTIKYLMSFAVSYLFGVALDLFNGVVGGVQVDTIIGRIALFTLGSAVISLGVASLMKSNYPILPFDTFVKEVSKAKGITISKFKTGFDLVCFVVSLTLSMVFFGEIRGINLGTLASALVLGSMIGGVIRLMNARVDGITILPEERARKVMDFDFLSFRKSKEMLNRDRDMTA